MEPTAPRELLAQLEDSLTSTDPSVRRKGAEVLERLGADAVEILRKGLGHANKYVRREAAGALGRLGREARTAVPDLAQALQDPHPKVRLAAALALQTIGPDARSAIPELMEALKATNLFFCRLVAKTLVQIGPAAVPDLVAALNHRDRFVRREAAWAIGQLGPLARLAVPTLIDVLSPSGMAPSVPVAPPRYERSTEDAQTRVTPIQLVKRDPQAPDDASQPASADATFCLYVVRALGSMAAEAQPAVPVLTTLRATADAKLREAVEQTLDQIRPDPTNAPVVPTDQQRL
jgi:HEAT repeat protein